LPFLGSKKDWKKETLNRIFVGIAYVRDGEWNIWMSLRWTWRESCEVGSW
jgi:hypothetical protein